MALWEIYYTATSVEEAVRLLADYGERARVIAGGTDLLIEIEHKTRTPAVLIDITRIGGLDELRLREDGLIHLGPMVTHAQAASSPLLQEHALPLAQACWWVGGPALRNRGTIAGNLVTASPANDTITALRALDATITLRSVRGERQVPISEFYTGVRRTLIAPDELLTDISFRPLKAPYQGVYLKLGLRRVLAIAVTNVAIVLGIEDGKVTTARITLGSVAPTIVRAPEAETALLQHPLDETFIEKAAELAAQAARPIDDVRGSAWFRKEEVVALVRRGLQALAQNQPRLDLPQPEAMPLLWGKSRCRPRLSGPTVAHYSAGDEPIQFRVNGENVAVRGANGKTLLHMLRDDLGLVGSKVGCEEGECGACTVWMDGIAILACLTPAPRAHGTDIVTIEGLSKDGELHPVQQAFVEEDAVQCGYCTPGFVMSAANLLEENPNPTREQIIAALSGNLCRCTGYYKIITAVEKASEYKGEK